MIHKPNLKDGQRRKKFNYNFDLSCKIFDIIYFYMYNEVIIKGAV